MRTSQSIFALGIMIFSLFSCDRPDPAGFDPDAPIPPLTLSGVARLFSELPISAEQVREVHDAVRASTEHGYDEEYLMQQLFDSPGTGVGSVPGQTRASSYTRPMRDLIRERLSDRVKTRAGAEAEIEAFIASLSASGMQIYWPFSSSWDGESLPVITFDPESEATANKGYQLIPGPDGTLTVRETLVDEALARKRPVWVINGNDDSAYLSLEQLRRQDPDWGKGGRVLVGRAPESPLSVRGETVTRAGGVRAGDDFRSLVLKDFKMKQHYDNWFRGASEFWVKCGSVQGFYASTEAEMRLYQPTVTDFMISVRRDQLDVVLPFDAIIISDWTEQLDSFAFLIVEDDGGTRTSWKVDATVKIQSKSYGFTVDIPYNQRDDIVWRGSLTSRYFEKYNGDPVHFGGVDVTFELR